MDKVTLHHVLSNIAVQAFPAAERAPIKAIAERYPWFAAGQLAYFASLESITHKDISSIAAFKSDPYLFAVFVKRCQEMQHRQNVLSANEAPKEDILALINEIPNSNPIEEAKELKAQNIPPPLDDIEQPDRVEKAAPEAISEVEVDKSLMVMMSFTDWLFHFKHKTEKEKQEEKDKKALKTSWQKEKLAALSEEEEEEIPEEIFKQAMDSISENTVISEPLAIILAKQGKTDKAIDMYKKLSLRNPEKNLYFADRIKELINIKDFT